MCWITCSIYVVHYGLKFIDLLYLLVYNYPLSHTLYTFSYFFQHKRKQPWNWLTITALCAISEVNLKNMLISFNNKKTVFQVPTLYLLVSKIQSFWAKKFLLFTPNEYIYMQLKEQLLLSIGFGPLWREWYLHTWSISVKEQLYCLLSGSSGEVRSCYACRIFENLLFKTLL